MHPSREAAIADVRAGATRTSVAAKYGIDRAILRQWLEEAGVPKAPPGPKRKELGEREYAIIDTYAAGASILDTAREHGVSRSCVHRLIVEAGVNRPRGKAPVVALTDDQWDEVIARYASGEVAEDLADELGVSKSAIRARAARAGIRKRSSPTALEDPYRLTGGRWVQRGLIKVWTGERPVDEPDTGYRHECADCGDELILAKTWVAMDTAAREQARAERKARRGNRNLCHSCHVRRRREGVAA